MESHHTRGWGPVSLVRCFILMILQSTRDDMAGVTGGAEFRPIDFSHAG